ncbi:MAG: DUF2079 domain-containing protein [Patescibacteria group bacterium]
MVSWSNLQKPIRRVLATVVVLLVVLFFARALQQSWGTVAQAWHAPDVRWLVLGLLGFSGFSFFRIFAWQHLSKALGTRLSYREAGQVIMLSDAVRYIPGNVWSVLGRMAQSAKFGMASGTGLYATIIEVAGMLAAAATLGGAFALFTSDLPSWVRYAGGLGAAGAVVAVFATKLVHRFLAWGMQRMGKQFVAAPIGGQVFCTIFVWELLAWTSYSVGGYLLLRAFQTEAAVSIVLALAALPLSWALGYLSFLTPSGIGVREAVLAGLLSVSLGPSSVIAATLVRLGATIAEFVCVGIFAWSYIRQGLVWLWQKIRTPAGIVVVFIIGFAVYFSIITLVMQSKVITSRFDLGNMDQTVWNTSQGRIFQFTNPYSTETVYRAIHHADFILILIAPLYWIFASPMLLLVLQACIVALGGWFVFRLARKVLGHEWLAAVLALSYLFYPTLQRAVLFDFHGLTLAPTFAIGMILAMVEKRWWRFAIFAILFALCKEELALMVAGVGVLMYFRDRIAWKRALTVIGLAVAYFCLVYFLIMPAARHGVPNKYTVLYDTLGSSPSEILKTATTNPRLIVSMVAGKQARHMYAGVMGPVGFLSIASPLWLAVAWPDFVVNLFNERIEPRTLIYHYQAAIGGFVFISTIFGIAALQRRFGAWWDRRVKSWMRLSLFGFLALFLLVIGAVESYRLSPLPYAQHADMRAYWRAPMAPVIHAAIDQIPENAPVSATNTVGAQLAEREHLYQFPQGIELADYILVLLAKEGSLEWQRNHVQFEDLQKDERFELVNHENNFWFFKKKGIE